MCRTSCTFRNSIPHSLRGRTTPSVQTAGAGAAASVDLACAVTRALIFNGGGGGGGGWCPSRWSDCVSPSHQSISRGQPLDCTRGFFYQAASPLHALRARGPWVGVADQELIKADPPSSVQITSGSGAEQARCETQQCNPSLRQRELPATLSGSSASRTRPNRGPLTRSARQRLVTLCCP